MFSQILHKGAAITALFFILGCSTTNRPVASEEVSTPPAGERFYVSYTHARRLELEPCGCSMSPLGGVSREYNLLSKWRRDGELLSFSGGGTFFPLVLPGVKTTPELGVKSKTLVKAMNQLGVNAVGITSNDLRVGIPLLLELSKEARFPFLSANLYSKKTKKRLFDPYRVYKTGERNIIIIGITDGLEPGVRVADADIKDPVLSLKTTLMSIPLRNRFVVVLSGLSASDRQKLVAKVPEVNLVLGSLDDVGLGTVQLTERSVASVPMDRARSIVRIRFEGPAEFNSLYSQKIAAQLEPEIYETRLRAVFAEENKQMKKAREAKAQLERLKRIPSEAGPATLTYTPEYEVLTSDYDEPRNVLQELLTSYHETLRAIAIAEE